MHITYDHCIVQFLQQAGGDPEWIQLAVEGIHGSGHSMHLKLNKVEIANLVHGWIQGQESNAS